MTRLEARSLSFSRPGRGIVLDGISFSLEAGGILAILGPNGAGKTTLLSLLCGRLAPDSGEALLDGAALETCSPRRLAESLAFLPQIERLPYNYKVLDFVLMGRTPHLRPLSMPGVEDEKMAREALDLLGLGHLAGLGAGEISGGEYQLVRIARCLAQGARILLLDEPTSLLDPANARRVAAELASLAAMGRTIIFATHDIALARSLADHVLLLARHRALRFGPPSETLTARLLGEVFGVDFDLEQIPTAYTNLRRESEDES
ncbi:MAG: ABC transporter ATP-binding protein [Spirochaetes bacterium]|nr:ABC transporter ATP-binding protein [Spirochaetota bacterium]